MTEAQKAEADAKAELEKAEKAYQESQAKYALGVLAYYQDTNPEVYALFDKNSESASPILGSTIIGDENDATSWENVLSSLELLIKCNELRKGDENFTGLNDLYVCDSAQAYAQLNANWAMGIAPDNLHHSGETEYGENLAWNYQNPFDGWYNYEKQLYNDGSREWNKIGHYLNICWNSDGVVGIGFSKLDSDYYYCSHALEVGGNTCITDEKTYTVKEYIDRLEEYKESITTGAENALNTAKAVYEEAVANRQAKVKALETAESALSASEAITSNQKNQLDDAKTKKNNTAVALTQTKQELTSLESKLNEAKGAKSKADQAVEKAQADVNAAKAVTQAKASALADAQVDVTDAEQGIRDAEEAISDQEAKVDSFSDELRDANKALREKKTELAAAKIVQDEAGKALTGAEKTYDAAEADIAIAETSKSSAGTTLAEKAVELSAKEMAYKTVKSEADGKNTLWNAYMNAQQNLENAKSEAEDAAEDLSDAKEAFENAKADVEAKRSELKAAQDALIYAEEVQNDSVLKAAIENLDFAAIRGYIRDNTYPELNASLEHILECIIGKETAEYALEQAEANYAEKAEAYDIAKKAYGEALSALAIATADYEKFNVKESSESKAADKKTVKTKAKGQSDTVKTGDSNHAAVPVAGMGIAVLGAAWAMEEKKKRSIRE